jgi:hypothetical protein
MADAIDNLAQDLNQANAVDEFPGYPGYKMGDLVPDMGGVRVGDLFYGLDPYGQEAPYNWRTGGFEFQAAPSDVGFGNIDYNIRDQPTERINIGNTDEQDALIRTGIGTPLDPVTQQRYNTTGTTPSPVGGVDYLTPKQIEDLTAGQTPSVPQGVVTRGETVKIPVRTIPDYTPIGSDTDKNIIYADPKNTRDSFLVPGVNDYPIVPNLSAPSTLTKGTDTPFTPSPVESYEPTTTSVGGFDNTGGNVTAGPGGVKDITPDWKEDAKPKPGDEFKDSPWSVFDPTGKDDSDYRDPKTGELFGTDQEGYKWNYRTGQFDCVGGRCSEKNPVEDTTKPPVVTTPPSGGTKPPGGGGQPGGGTPGGGPPGGGTPGRGPTPLPPREPVTPLVRREVVIPTKGTKEVPLPDRQADPFAKLYADLLANSQQQQDQYRYINYDPDQIMNAAMSGFRRRGAMRSLQG